VGNWQARALPNHFPERRDRKACLIHQCLEFHGKLAHFVGRLGTMPTGADFGEFSGKEFTHGGDQNKARDDPDDVSRTTTST